MNLLYTKKDAKKKIFKTSKKLVDNHIFYLENLKKAILRVLNSYLKSFFFFQQLVKFCILLLPCVKYEWNVSNKSAFPASPSSTSL
jgi:hypothetical protein